MALLSAWYRHPHLVPFPVTACQDPGDDSEATAHRFLPLLRTMPPLSAIRTAASRSAMGDAAFFLRFFLAMVCVTRDIILRR